ncbi:response regulator [Sulfurimonas aquatica]|nr:response regulator [Sulfurimonas aquatica]
MKYLFIFLSMSTLLLSQELIDQTFMNDSERVLWILLSIASLIALISSSYQFIKLKKEYSKVKERQNVIKDAQDKIISDMSENIYSVVQDVVSKEGLLSQKIEENPQDRDLVKVMDSEKKLYDMTGNLIEFLRLKSKKVEIVNNNFTFVNLLNDISGSLINDFKNSNVELIYDVDSDIPYILMGDTLNLGNILRNILEYSMYNKSRKTLMHVTKVNEFSLVKKLNFTITTDIKFDVDESLFNYNYNEETNQYEGLGLFIAKDLSLLMDGKLSVKNTKSKNVEFSLTIPFHSAKDTEKKYRRQLDKRLANKKVLVVDDNPDSALALEKIFLNFKYSVKVENRNEYLQNLYDFSMYDMVVIDERLFTTKALASLKESDCKVVSVENFFSSSTLNIDGLDVQHLNKPFTQERIYHILSEAYIPQEKKDLLDETKHASRTQKLKVNRGVFDSTPNVTLQRFSEFKGRELLLVEDNLINQKVIVSLLGKSGIGITIANNGEEAVEIVNSDKEFDLVLMDINMPLMDGYTASQIIRENPKFDMLPIISLSALTSTDEVRQMFNSGMNGYIAKPLKKEKLFSAFSMFMQKSEVVEETDEGIQEKVSYDGLDIEHGVEQIEGNTMLYKELLMEFKDAYGKSDEFLAELIEDHRYEQAKMLCLDLKGLSGSICAYDMNTLATEMHKQLLYKKYEFLPKFVQDYSVEIQKLNNSIALYTKDI